MLNNKGQSVVIFIICLPLLLLFLSYVYDVVNVKYEKRKMTNIVNNIPKNEENKCDIVSRNDEDITCEIKGSTLEAKKRIKSLFGKIINKDYYEVKVVINI